jgi:hypothetical protein
MQSVSATFWSVWTALKDAPEGGKKFAATCAETAAHQIIHGRYMGQSFETVRVNAHVTCHMSHVSHEQN